MSIKDMFADKVYNEMDEISKLVEPIESDVNIALSQMPDEIEITPELLLSQYDEDYGWSSISIRSLVQKKAKALGLTALMSGYDLGQKFYRFEVRDLEDGDEVTVDFENDTMSHEVFLIKFNIGFTDAELEDQVKTKILGNIKGYLRSSRTVNKPRLNELADLFGATEVKAIRTYRGKVRKFCEHLTLLIDERKLDIRDLSLCQKFSEWVVLYVRDGNLAALNNITRIKIIMHENRPIYSISERSVE